MNYDSSDIACVLKYNVYLHLNLFLSDYVWFLDLSLTKVRLVLAELPLLGGGHFLAILDGTEFGTTLESKYFLV